MNVKIANKYALLLANLDVDFIKSVEGEFTPEEIIMQFSNFFFNKMVFWKIYRFIGDKFRSCRKCSHKA